MIRHAIFGAALLSAVAAMATASAPGTASDTDAAIGGTGLPRTLSAYGFFDDARAQEPAARVTPYRLNTPLYSDGADKLRFLYLPDGTPMSADGEGRAFLEAATELDVDVVVDFEQHEPGGTGVSPVLAGKLSSEARRRGLPLPAFWGAGWGGGEGGKLFSY